IPNCAPALCRRRYGITANEWTSGASCFMDLATLIGFVGALGVIAAAITLGGDPVMFLNGPSVIIVLGGTSMAVLIKFPLGQFLSAFKVAGRAFRYRGDDPQSLIDQTVELAQVARKEGLLALE